MASSNIKMEGTNLIKQVTLTIKFKPATQIRSMLARRLLALTNWIAPFEVVSIKSDSVDYEIH